MGALIYPILFICFGSKLYRQIVGIPMDTNCAPPIADLFLFSFEVGFIASFSNNKEAEIIQAFNCTSRYLDDLLNIGDPTLKAWWVDFIHLNYI